VAVRAAVLPQVPVLAVGLPQVQGLQCCYLVRAAVAAVGLLGLPWCTPTLCYAAVAAVATSQLLLACKHYSTPGHRRKGQKV
jgi:hypothetical protein